MDNHEDALEFIEESSKYSERCSNEGYQKKNYEECVKAREESSNIANSPCQYSLNGTGFSPTTATISKLPPGVYTPGSINNAFTYIPEDMVTDKLIKFPDSRSDLLLKEIENFWNLKDEFKKGNSQANGGFLHKRGYLLYGPPGSGKTCLIKLVIKDIVSKGGIVLLGNCSPYYVITGLKLLRLIEPEKPVVVLFEDFDALLERHDESEYLSLLDGENSVDNVLFLATTNYPSKLDPRLYNRPGRFSDVIKIGMPSSEARRLYLETQLKDSRDIDRIVENTDGFSLDHLKALVLGVYFEKKDLNKEIERLRILFKPIKDDSGSRNSIGLASSSHSVSDEQKKGWHG